MTIESTNEKYKLSIRQVIFIKKIIRFLTYFDYQIMYLVYLKIYYSIIILTLRSSHAWAACDLFKLYSNAIKTLNQVQFTNEYAKI